MADLQTDGARVLSQWRNEGISSYRKRPRDPGQLAQLMIDIDSGEDREAGRLRLARELHQKRLPKSPLS